MGKSKHSTQARTDCTSSGSLFSQIVKKHFGSNLVSTLRDAPDRDSRMRVAIDSQASRVMMRFPGSFESASPNCEVLHTTCVCVCIIIMLCHVLITHPRVDTRVEQRTGTALQLPALFALAHVRLGWSHTALHSERGDVAKKAYTHLNQYTYNFLCTFLPGRKQTDTNPFQGLPLSRIEQLLGGKECVFFISFISLFGCMPVMAMQTGCILLPARSSCDS